MEKTETHLRYSWIQRMKKSLGRNNELPNRGRSSPCHHYEELLSNELLNTHHGQHSFPLLSSSASAFFVGNSRHHCPTPISPHCLISISIFLELTMNVVLKRVFPTGYFGQKPLWFGKHKEVREFEHG